MLEGLLPSVARRAPRISGAVLSSLVACAIGLAPARTAHAVEPTPAAIQEARTRFSAARRLEEAGRWSEALDEFRRVARVKMTPQVRFHIALCLENTGSLTRALEGFAQASRDALAMPEAVRDPQVVLESAEHIASLERRIPTLTVSAYDLRPGDEIRLDGARHAGISGTFALRVDPGTHVAELRRDRKVVAREVVRAREGGVFAVTLEVGQIMPDPFDRRGPEDDGASSRPAASTQPETLGGTGPARYIAFAAFASATAAAVTTVGFARARQRALDDVRGACPTLKDCPPSVAPAVERGRSHAFLVNVFGGVSIVSLAVGVAALATAPAPPAAPRGRPPKRANRASQWRQPTNERAFQLRGAVSPSGVLLGLGARF